MLTVLDLFSGIGGFSMGLERTGGFKTVAFCEIDPFCRKVLAKHWPGVPVYEDVRTLSLANGFADVICGGFPCQDVSLAGQRAGLDGTRSGLWSEYARLVGEIRPRYVLVENTPGLLSLGLGDVLGDLAALGYDAEWHCIPAAAVGAPHLRDRVWIVANARSEQHEGNREEIGRAPTAQFPDADADSRNWDGWPRHVQMGWGRCAGEAANDGLAGRNEWAAEPALGRVAYGVPNRLERLTALGNAVVPQIPELIGRAILKAEGIAA